MADSEERALRRIGRDPGVHGPRFVGLRGRQPREGLHGARRACAGILASPDRRPRGGGLPWFSRVPEELGDGARSALVSANSWAVLVHG